MNYFRFAVLLFLVVFTGSALFAQVSAFPFIERFDSVTTPSLPLGWITSSNRLASGDYFSTTSSPHSSPNALQSANSSIPQYLLSPIIDFSGRIPDKLQFWTARSGTHTSPLVVEASTDGGTSFPVILGDTLRNPGTTGYLHTDLLLPEFLSNQNDVRFRWRLLGGTGGTAGTFRMDDIRISTLISYDLSIANGPIEPPLPSTSDELSVTFTVHNVGTFSSPGADVRFFLDANDNHTADSGEQFLLASFTSLAPGDSTTVSATHPPLRQGSYRFIAVVELPTDENSSNDTTEVDILVGVPPGSVVMNEIMYEPLSGKSEWFELYNPGDVEVDLRGWAFSGAPSAAGSVSRMTITDTPTPVPGGEFAVISSDSTILQSSIPSFVPVLILNKSAGLGLGNEGDDLVLKDRNGVTIDSVRYSPSWHQPALSQTRGRSLERINPEFDSNDPHNWSTSASKSGGSPGTRNTIYTSRISVTGHLSFSPNPFSPDGDGYEDFCLISYSLPRTTALIRITVFDLRGRVVRTLANSDLSGDHGEILWDGRDDEGRQARIGPHIVLLEAVDGQGGSVVALKGVVVVAAKL